MMPEQDAELTGGVLWRLQMLMAAGYVMPRGDGPQPEKLVLYHPNLGNPRINLFEDGHMEMRAFHGDGNQVIAAGDPAAFDAVLKDIKPANLAQNLFGRSSYLMSMIYLFGAALFMTWLVSAMLG